MACTHAGTHVFTHVCLHVYTHVSTHVSTHVYTRVYTHACTHVHPQVIDASASIYDSEWEQQMTFARALVNHMGIAKAGVNAGVYAHVYTHVSLCMSRHMSPWGIAKAPAGCRWLDRIYLCKPPLQAAL